MQSTSFLETQTIIDALEFAISKGAFRANPKQKKTATAILQRMKSHRSVSGRHQQVLVLLAKGATIDQMIKTTRSSRRTVFRYLNHLEDAGTEIELVDGRYRIKK